MAIIGSPPPTSGAWPPRAAMPPNMLLENQAGSLCRALGYSEIITYSFVSPPPSLISSACRRNMTCAAP